MLASRAELKGNLSIPHSRQPLSIPGGFYSCSKQLRCLLTTFRKLRDYGTFFLYCIRDFPILITIL